MTSAGRMKREKGSRRAAARWENGGSDLLKLDDALASVDDFVAARLK